MPPDDEGAAMAPSRLDLFLGFTRVAAFAFGGVLPWARFVVVERRRWLSSEEFTDILAMSQLLPGPNIVNMAVAIGARFRGPTGSLAAVAGLLVLPVAVVLMLASLYGRFAELPAVQGALGAMAAAAAGLVLAMAAKIAEPVLRARFRVAAPFVVATFVAVAVFRLPLWPVIAVVAPLSVLASLRRR